MRLEGYGLAHGARFLSLWTAFEMTKSIPVLLALGSAPHFVVGLLDGSS
jgi:hypothetical protein